MTPYTEREVFHKTIRVYRTHYHHHYRIISSTLWLACERFEGNMLLICRSWNFFCRKPFCSFNVFKCYHLCHKVQRTFKSSVPMFEE